jgi:hypothetical protein
MTDSENLAKFTALKEKKRIKSLEYYNANKERLNARRNDKYKVLADQFDEKHPNKVIRRNVETPTVVAAVPLPAVVKQGRKTRQSTNVPVIPKNVMIPKQTTGKKVLVSAQYERNDETGEMKFISAKYDKKNQKKKTSISTDLPVYTVNSISQYMQEHKDKIVFKTDLTKPVSDSTANTYIRNIKVFGKAINGSDDILRAFIDVETAKKSLESFKNIKDGKIYSLESHQAWLTAAFSGFRVMGFDKIDNKKLENAYKEWNTYFDIVTAKKAAQTKLKRTDPTRAVPTWDEYESKILAHYKKDSLEHLITVLYRYNTLRNDFINVPINTQTDKIKGIEAFYIPPKKANIQFVKVDHKNKNRVGDIEAEFPKIASDVIRSYIKKNDIKNGESLIDKKSIASIANKMHAIVGFKPVAGEGGTRIFRHISSGQDYSKEEDIERTVRLAQTMGHSTQTHQNVYQRVIRK